MVCTDENYDVYIEHKNGDAPQPIFTASETDYHIEKIGGATLIMLDTYWYMSAGAK